MKRILAIFLILAMMLSLCIVAQAEETVEKKQYSLLNWDYLTDIPDDVLETYTNVFYAPLFWSSNKRLESGDLDGMVYEKVLKKSKISDLAAAVKELFDTYPDGARYINFNLLSSTVKYYGDMCFIDAAIEPTTKWLDAFLAEYKSIGGKLDGLIGDVEYLDMYAYYLECRYYEKDDTAYKRIVENPIYQEKIRPMLVERGFPFYEKLTDMTPEIYTIDRAANNATARAIWDTVLESYINATLTECVAPLWKYYPDAIYSDYTCKDILPWVKEQGSSGGNKGSAGIEYGPGTAGNVPGANTASNENFYTVRPSTDFFQGTGSQGRLFKTIATRVDAIFENTIFNRFMFEANYGKTTWLSSTNKQVTWWLAHAYYGESRARNYYHAETILHLGLLDPEAFHGYIMMQDCTEDGAPSLEKYQNALQIADDCLKMLSDLVGYTDAKPLAVEPNWNHKFVLSGMYANGRNVFRITPDDQAVTLEDFLVEGAKDPTFRVGDETITFPGGKIIEDVEIVDIGTYGYWVETAKDVMPVLTRADDYFRNNPSYQETFDGYEIGMEYNYNNVKPLTLWEPKKVGTGSAVVIADPTDANNKVLEIKGNYMLKNVKMPANIIAGDTYAEYQAWEVSFTLPSDVAEDDELQLLYAVNEKKKSTDQGILITGTKVSFDKGGQWAELADVTLTPGGKYTIVREMDFATEGAFTSSYYIYDADGKELGSVKNVPVENLEIPTYSINLSVKNPSGAAILLDDYKLYPTKVNSDFYLYDGKTGLQIKETEQAQDGNVGYRFAWLNATGMEKSYTVMAAYYDGENKVSEEVVLDVKMAPYADGVFSGLVENKQEGKKMLVYLKDNNPSENEEIPTIGADVEEPGVNSPDTTVIIVVAAAAAVVVIAIIVIVIVASSKKKKKAAAQAPATEEKTEE